MARNTTNRLGPYFESIIDRKVSSGKYPSRIDVMKSALTLLEERDKNIEALQKALIEGEESGFVEDFNPEKHLKKLHEKYL